MVRINDRLEIPDEELTFTTGRAGGPGGQNVNKRDTSVTLAFDVTTSPSLGDRDRALLLGRLANRITDAGTLQLTCRTERTQGANRRLIVERFAAIIAKALVVATPRRATKPTRGSQRRRLDAKKRRGDTKKLRTRRPPRDD